MCSYFILLAMEIPKLRQGSQYLQQHLVAGCTEYFNQRKLRKPQKHEALSALCLPFSPNKILRPSCERRPSSSQRKAKSFPLNTQGHRAESAEEALLNSPLCSIYCHLTTPSLSNHTSPQIPTFSSDLA